MKAYLNLLPWKYRRAGLLRTLLPRWCVVWGLAAVLMALLVWQTERRNHDLLAVLADRESAYRPVAALATDNARMRKEMQRFERRETLVGQMRNEKPVLCFLNAVSTSVQACRRRLVVRDLRFRQGSERPSERGRVSNPVVAAPESEATLILAGDALDNLAIAQFAAALQGTDLFRDVVLESSVGTVSADRTIHSFVVRCEI